MKKIVLLLTIFILTLSACNLPNATAIANPTADEAPAESPTTAPATVTAKDTASPRSTAAPLAADAHPRLWLTPDSVEKYRGWANDNNPLWKDGLALLAERAKSEMDEGRVPDQDCGNIGYEEYPTESYAELFAFLSLIHPDEAARIDYAKRAHSLLMHIMNEAAKGPASAEDFTCNETTQYPAFRHPDFYTSDRDRARYHGEAFPLTVDWIYPSLSTEDKATIRKVFLQWSEDIITRGYHHPEPVGVLNDPQLLADLQQVRFSGNNYYAAHLRNLGLMAMSFSPKDDADGKLRQYLESATGSYLYIFNHFLETDARGGTLPEGFEYSPQTASYVTQFLWGMKTSQAANAEESVHKTFWNDFISNYLHAISPAPTQVDHNGEMMSVYEPSWYGDSQHYTLPDFIDSFAALSHVLDTAEAENALRWSAIHTAPGGADRLLERAGNPDDLRRGILYFMLLDPTAPEPTDPRLALPLDNLGPGLGRVFSRTGWDKNASWFTFRIGWNSIDHQMADGNHFEFYRKGEWLTKARAGYANIAEGIASSEFYNTITVANDRPFERSDDDWRMDLWQRGSQWNLVSSGDPKLVAHSFNPLFTFATGDATNLYNSESEITTDVVHASRSIVWLKPDYVITYDRAESKTDGRFKRWWLQLAQPATINGNQATSSTASGQQLFVTALLPESVTLKAVNTDEQLILDTTATSETMTKRLVSEATSSPRTVRFLHMLQGADAGSSPATAAVIQSDDKLWEGAAVNGTAILFAQTLGQTPPASLAYTFPADVTLHIISGLTPGAGYNIKIESGRIVITSGSQIAADDGGVLVVK